MAGRSWASSSASPGARRPSTQGSSRRPRQGGSFSSQMAMVQSGAAQRIIPRYDGVIKRGDFHPPSPQQETSRFSGRPSTSNAGFRPQARAQTPGLMQGRYRRASVDSPGGLKATSSPIRRAVTPGPGTPSRSSLRIVSVGKGHQRVGGFADAAPETQEDRGDLRPSTAAAGAVRRKSEPAAAVPPRPTTRSSSRRLSSGGFNFASPLAEGTEVYAWGWNSEGQCGVDSPDDAVAAPVRLTSLDEVDVVAMSASPFHCLLNTVQGDVLAWGSNECGQLGASPEAERRRLLPAPVLSLSAYRIWRVAAGHSHSVAVTHTGEVLTWGGRRSRTVVEGEEEDVAVPRPVLELQGHVVVDVCCGRGHTLALTASGRVFSWGVANDMVAAGGAPALVATSIQAISSGDNHSLLLLQDGRVMSLGSAEHGRLGLGFTTRRGVREPTLVPGLTGIAHVSAGGATSFAVEAESGRLFAWGYNHYGQAGVGDTTNRDAPTVVEAFLDAGVVVRSATAGADHSLAVSTAGNVYVWGRVLHGRLGVTATETGQDVQPIPYLLEVFARKGMRVSQVYAAGASSIAAVLRRQQMARVASRTCAASCIAHGPGLDPKAPVADVWQEFTIQARDGDGKNRLDGGDVFAVSLSGREGQVRVVDRGDGTYDVRYLVESPGACRVSVALHSMKANERGSAVVGEGASTPICNSPFAVCVQPGPADAAASVVSGPGLRAAVAGETAAARIEARFRDGAGKACGGDQFRARLLPSADRSGDCIMTIACSIDDAGDGSYELAYEPEVAGAHSLVVELRQGDGGWAAVGGSPFAVSVAPGACCPSRCRVEGVGVEGPLMVGVTSTFTVTACDSSGNQCHRGGEQFYAQVTTSTASVLVSVNDLHDGSYRCLFQPESAGEHIVAVMWSKQQVSQLAHLPGSPFTVQVDPKPRWPAAEECIISGDALNYAAVGEELLVRVVLCDADGPVGIPHSAPCPLFATCRPSSRRLEVRPVVADPSAFDVVFSSPRQGLFDLTLSLKGRGKEAAMVALRPKPVAVAVVDPVVLRFYQTGSIAADVPLPPSFYYVAEPHDRRSGLLPLDAYAQQSAPFVVCAAPRDDAALERLVAEAAAMTTQCGGGDMRVAALVISNATGGAAPAGPITRPWGAPRTRPAAPLGELLSSASSAPAGVGGLAEHRAVLLKLVADRLGVALGVQSPEAGVVAVSHGPSQEDELSLYL